MRSIERTSRRSPWAAFAAALVAVAVLGWERAWGVLEVPALEVASGARRIEVYGTEGAFVIPHLGSGHLRNDQVQPVEVYRKGWGDGSARSR